MLGRMRGAELLDWLSALPVRARDRALEEHLGITGPAPDSAALGPDAIGYHPSGVAAIVRALADVPVQREDVLYDLGAGLGKVVLSAHLLTGVTARGIEVQPGLVARARAAAARLGVDTQVQFTEADAQHADLDSGTVFYLYAPFTGATLRAVLARLERVATERAIVVCALGVDLHRLAPWLVPRPSEAFWLTLYDSVVSGVAPRAVCAGYLAARPSTDIVTLERAGPTDKNPIKS
jgi:hypothetical protein